MVSGNLTLKINGSSELIQQIGNSKDENDSVKLNSEREGESDINLRHGTSKDSNR